MKRIAVLYHEREEPESAPSYIVSSMAPVWRELGIEVIELYGTASSPDVDLLIPQINLSVLPDAYVRFLERFPNVMNRRVREISKSAISTQRVWPGDAWEGPVIVKTDRNCGGQPERRVSRRRPWVRQRNRLRRWWLRLRSGEPDPLAVAEHLDPRRYPVFPSLSEIPPGVFQNRVLIVERFLPEMDAGLYCLRNYTFCGERDYAFLRRSADPIVKASSAAPPEEISVPDPVLDVRRSLGIDLGKIDFVIHDGEVAVLDVNWTPTFAAASSGPAQQKRARWLAEGVLDADSGLRRFG